jgi:hypothetical protein
MRMLLAEALRIVPRRSLGLTGALCLLAVAGACRVAAQEQIVASIENIEREGLYRELFSLTRPAEVEIDAIGSGSQEFGGALLAYAWILDLRSRVPVWKMDASAASQTKHENNLRERETVLIPAGDYALYFAAYGGSFPVEKKIRILDLLNLGSVSIQGGHMVDWNEYGDPAEWKAVVRLTAADATGDLVRNPAAEPDLGSLVRLAPLENNVVRRARLDLSAPARMRLLAVGEYSASCRGFADAAWITGIETCERVWEMTLVNTEPAGGGEKNRRFDKEVELSAGAYTIEVASDATHAYGNWNTAPPYDPESWGLTLIPLTPLAPGVARVTLDPPYANVIVRIDRVGDGQYRESLFRLTHAADFHVRALGEWDKTEDRYFDFGWIEDPLQLKTIWTMESLAGVYAGGECRNRLVEDRVHLEPGIYQVGYVSDDAHSFDGWSNEPPFDASAWGIQVCGVGADFSPAWVTPIEGDAIDRTLIRIAPVRDDENRRVRFQVREPLTVRIVAIGEGRHGDMFDYGWLENETTGATVWQMQYPDTRPAGGAQKNRRVDRLLKLDPGTYVLHYETDDSHAFGSWNDTPPDDPQLYGVTLIEIPGD